MRYRIAALIPIVVAGVVVALETAAGSPDRLRALWQVQVPLVKTLGCLGCYWAALKFDKGDYLRKAWFYTGTCLLLLMVKDVAFGTGSHFQQPQTFSLVVQYARGGITFLANVSAIVGTWMLARTWRVAGIALPGSERGRTVVILIAVVISIGIAGQATWVDVRSVASGNMGELVGVASDVGDIVTLVLLAPVLLTAIALRGGLLVWPWALLTLSSLGWLVYDGAATIGHFVHAEPIGLRCLEEVFRAIACSGAFAAGLAQVWAIGERAEENAAPPQAAQR